MQTLFTTTTGPAWTFTFADALGNALNISGGTFKLTFRCVNNLLKVQGGGSFSITNASAGQAQYTLGTTDMATAYALASSFPGSTQFEVYAEATVSGLVYDALPVVIEIRKI